MESQALGLLDRVRRACREVVARARQVVIRDELLRQLAESLSPEDLALPELDPTCHWLGHGADTAAFMLMLEAVNFGSGYFPDLRPHRGRQGYFAVAGALYDRFADVGVPTAEELTTWSAEHCAQVFGQDPTSPAARELMGLFAAALRELGAHVLRRHDGRFVALVENAGGSAQRLVMLLAEIPGFADIAHYEELEVPFLKRAQLAAADLSLAFDGQGLGWFHDLDRLTTFADDQVPHVLRTDGVLAYHDELAGRIARGELLAPGSPEEVEIRAATVVAVERLAEELGTLGRPTWPMRVDYCLWNRGLEARYSAGPRHRTLGRFY